MKTTILTLMLLTITLIAVAQTQPDQYAEYKDYTLYQPPVQPNQVPNTVTVSDERQQISSEQHQSEQHQSNKHQHPSKAKKAVQEELCKPVEDEANYVASTLKEEARMARNGFIKGIGQVVLYAVGIVVTVGLVKILSPASSGATTY